MRVKCIHRWSRAACCSSAEDMAVSSVLMGFLSGRCCAAAALVDDVREHEDDGDAEDHGADHVDLRRDRDPCASPDEEREGRLRARYKVGDDEVVDRKREGDERPSE